MDKYKGDGFDVFRSKKFWTATLGVVAMIIVSFVPELEAHLETLIPAIVGIIGVAIGGFALQDTTNPPAPKEPGAPQE